MRGGRGDGEGDPTLAASSVGSLVEDFGREGGGGVVVALEGSAVAKEVGFGIAKGVDPGDLVVEIV